LSLRFDTPDAFIALSALFPLFIGRALIKIDVRQMAGRANQQSVLNILENLNGLEPLKELFWNELNYERINEPISRRGWNETAFKALADDPVLFAGGGENNDFKIILARLDAEHVRLGRQRAAVNRLLRDFPYALFVFSNRDRNAWHFVNVKYDAEVSRRRLFRRISVAPGDRLRTASERIAMLDLADIGADLLSFSPLTIQQRHDEAFDVEAVTNQFFKEYKALFGILQDDLRHQTKDKEWAYDYALQFLNRCMFLYFIQRKRWLGSDSEFLRSFWEAYRSSDSPADSFFERWLKVLFFEAFNNKFHGGHRHFPDEIKDALAMAPYLNGGLFSENDLDSKQRFNITDARFAQVFTFLERYNFTIAEDSPLDQEVAVDPEMIGKVYESLVNVSSEADERGDAGIFYTPRTEIDLMCRLSLVDHLANHLGNDRKNLLYEMVFALEAEEKVAADEAVSQAKLWPELDSRLKDIAVVDPACGSGSFLVGILHVLDDVQQRANWQLGRNESAFDRKKRIIGQTLYGVDVMDWACHVAELRLWLALVVDARFTREELHARREPLLPHFTFKIRCGDSLVEEVGGINLAHLHGANGMPASLRARITKLKREKMRFYNNESDRQFRSADQARQEELNVFRAVLEAREKAVEDEIRSLRRRIEGPSERQVRLDGTIEIYSHQMGLEATELQKKIDSLQAELQRVGSARGALKTAKDVPFVWDIAFVEIFTEEKDGFDIVIGNPPYVRQENISDPRLPRERVTTENKKAYKAKLTRSVYQAFPGFFGYKASVDTAVHKLDAKSDLYVYFYFHGLSLLNARGTLCFITSHSWLDVGYGKDLQEFVLRRSHLKFVIDNQAKRSFSQADVNTVIVLFSSPNCGDYQPSSKRARFVAFTVPFEHVLSPVIFEEIEAAPCTYSTREYRVRHVQQDVLLADDHASDDHEERHRKALVTGRYEGDQWGGKYLRSPDIFHDVLAKCAVDLKPLKSLAQIRFGIKTGCNEFFYLPSDYFDIKESSGRWQLIPLAAGLPKDIQLEANTLRPVIFSLKEIENLNGNGQGFQKRILLLPPDTMTKLPTGARKYIEWGKSQGFHTRASCKSRQPWYSLAKGWPAAAFIIPSKIGERMVVLWNKGRILEDKKLYGVTPNGSDYDPYQWAVLLNSTWLRFYLEMTARQLTGAQAIADIDVRIVERSLVIDPVRLNKERCRKAVEGFSRKIESCFVEFGLSKDRPITEQQVVPKQDRTELDNIVFDVLGLSQSQREAIYKAVATVVKNRLDKAESV
jgi:hypothetical protein